jgi:putative endonuclease
MDKRYYVYILASRSRILYTGITNNLQRRVAEHRLGILPGFTSSYRIFRLVHYEIFGDVRMAIAREKEIKAWRREKKVWLIKKHNPTWADLAADWYGKTVPPVARNPKEESKADPSPPSKIRPGSG